MGISGEGAIASYRIVFYISLHNSLDKVVSAKIQKVLEPLPPGQRFGPRGTPMGSLSMLSNKDRVVMAPIAVALPL